jgi:hypothetical protein
MISVINIFEWIRILVADNQQAVFWTLVAIGTPGALYLAGVALYLINWLFTLK